MCRFLGFVSQPPTTLRRALGERYGDFVRLAAERHGDGWGIAWPEGEGVAFRKRPRSAADDDGFAQLSDSLVTDAALVHLRWATLDLGVSYSNTHPFGDGRLAFAHNGSITAMPSLDALGAGDCQPDGETDSEIFWLVVRAAIARTGDPALGLAEALLALDQTCQFTSLNCLLLSPSSLVAACWHRPQDRPREVGPDYYDLAYQEREGVAVVASSGWHGPGWSPVPNGSLLVADRAGGPPRVEEVREMLRGQGPAPAQEAGAGPPRR